MTQSHSALAYFTTLTLGIAGIIAIALPNSANPVHPRVQAVVEHLVGVMDTSAQAAANPKAPSVQMTNCSVVITIAGKNENIYPDL